MTIFDLLLGIASEFATIGALMAAKILRLGLFGYALSFSIGAFISAGLFYIAWNIKRKFLEHVIEGHGYSDGSSRIYDIIAFVLCIVLVLPFGKISLRLGTETSKFALQWLR